MTPSTRWPATRPVTARLSPACSRDTSANKFSLRFYMQKPLRFSPGRLFCTCAPAAGNSRTRRPGAGLSASAASSPAMQPVVRLGRPQSGSPCHFPPRAAAPSKSRTVFLLRPVSHARDCFQVRARARLLFSQTSRDPVSCSLRRGGNPPGAEKHRHIPHAQKRPKS